MRSLCNVFISGSPIVSEFRAEHMRKTQPRTQALLFYWRNIYQWTIYTILQLYIEISIASVSPSTPARSLYWSLCITVVLYIYFCNKIKAPGYEAAQNGHYSIFKFQWSRWSYNFQWANSKFWRNCTKSSRKVNRWIVLSLSVNFPGRKFLAKPFKTLKITHVKFLVLSN